MLATHPSIEGLARIFGCDPHIEHGPPELGVLQYKVMYETETERVDLSVLPLAGEVGLSITVKNPSRFFRLALADVSSLTATDDSDGQRIEIAFHTEETQPVTLYLAPVLVLTWGNQKDSPDRHPPWERD